MASIAALTQHSSKGLLTPMKSAPGHIEAASVVTSWSNRAYSEGRPAPSLVQVAFWSHMMLYRVALAGGVEVCPWALIPPGLPCKNVKT